MSHNSGIKSGKPSTGSRGIRLTLKLSIWGACLAAALVMSVIIKLPVVAPGAVAYVTICAMTSVAYLAVFTHCFMRLAYCRCPSWVLYTSGFAALSLSGMIGVVIGLGLVKSEVTCGRLDLLRSALMPVSITLLLFAAHALRASSHGLRSKTWKICARALLVIALILVLWRSGGWHYISQAARSTNIEPLLVIYITGAVASISLLLGIRRLAGSSPDEIVVPVCYWSVAMAIGSVLTLIAWTFVDTMRFRIMGIELAGVAALLIGLSIENERAHRGAAQQMSDLEAMQKVSWSLVGTSDPDELVSAFVKAISEGFQNAPAVVYLPDGSENSLTIAAVNEINDLSIYAGKKCSLAPGRRPGFHNGHTAKAFASGETQIVKVIYSDVEFMPWSMVANEEGIVISVPLPYQDSVIGVVNLFFSGVESVADDRIKQLEAIAAAVSPAIENARLRSSIKTEYQKLAA